VRTEDGFIEAIPVERWSAISLKIAASVPIARKFEEKLDEGE
jgi:hypothetical protein